MEEKQIPVNFSASIVEDSFSPTADPDLYSAKVRIFYKYANRNGSYITDEVAEQIINSAGYRPVVGWYNHETEDFEGHMSSGLAKAYGVVIPNSFSWEEHLDNDGVQRTYACCQVILWAEYWEEAKKILGKSQSMEISWESIEGTWEDIGDMPMFVYTQAKLAALCILGDNHEPCFQGSAFFENDENYIRVFEAIKKVFDLAEEQQNVEEDNPMNVKVFGLENSAIWNYLNPNFEENGEILEVPFEVDETNFFACGGKKIKKYKYETIEATEENEATVSYEVVEEFDIDEVRNTLNEVNKNFEELTAASEAALAVYEQEKADHEAAVANFNSTIAELNAQIEELTAVKAEYEKKKAEEEENRKFSLIEKFEEKLPEEEIETIRTSVSEFSYEELENKLSVLFTQYNFENSEGRIYVHHDEENEYAALSRLLQKYKK